MTVIRNPMSLMRRAVLPALGALIIVNFLGYAIMGQNGLLAWGDYRRAKAERAVQLAELQAEKARLQHRAELLDPRGADPDLVDELIRRDLGLMRPDEVSIPLEGTAPPRQPSGR